MSEVVAEHGDVSGGRLARAANPLGIFASQDCANSTGCVAQNKPEVVTKRKMITRSL
jgi:hypothetical protein